MFNSIPDVQQAYIYVTFIIVVVVIIIISGKLIWLMLWVELCQPNLYFPVLMSGVTDYDFI